jgi:hypothetical protein
MDWIWFWLTWDVIALLSLPIILVVGLIIYAAIATWKLRQN